MRNSTKGKRTVVWCLIKFILLAVFLNGVAVAAEKTDVAGATALKARLDLATTFYKLYEFDSTIRITRDIIASEQFESLDIETKIAAGLLLIRAYWEQEKFDEVKNAIETLLKWKRDYPFDSLDIDKGLKELAKKIVDSLPPPSAWSFCKPPITQPIKAGVGKHSQIRITTCPSSVPVTISLIAKADNIALQQLDSVSAMLTYTPLPSEARTTRTIRVTGESPDTTKSLDVTFSVSGGRSTSWWVKRVAIGVGGVAVIYGAYRLAKWLLHKDKEEKQLPLPPNPPGKFASIQKSQEKGMVK